MAATWFASIFNVHPEQAYSRVTASAAAIPVAYPRERDLVRGRSPWLRPCQAIIRIADFARLGPRAILAGAGVQIRIQAGAIERIEETRMEVPIVPPCM